MPTYWTRLFMAGVFGFVAMGGGSAASASNSASGPASGASTTGAVSGTASNSKTRSTKNRIRHKQSASGTSAGCVTLQRVVQSTAGTCTSNHNH